MGKVIKIFLAAVSTVILTFIILPVIVWLLLMLPSVQNFAARKAAEFASRKIQSEVRVDKVNLRLPSTADIHGFYVSDHNGDTLLNVGRVRANISIRSLLKKNISLGRVILDDTELHLRQQPDSTANIKSIIEKMKRDEPRVRDKPFSMDMASLQLNNFSFRLIKYYKRNRGTAFDYDDMHIRDVHLSGERVRIYGDSVTMNLRSLSASEKGGFTLNQLTSPVFSISGRGLILEDAVVSASGSHIEIGHLNFLYGTWQDYSDFVNAVYMDATIANSTVDFSTIGYFVPKLYGNGLRIEKIQATVQGPVKDMRGVLNSAVYDNTSVSAGFRMSGLPDIRRATIDSEIRELRSNAEDIISVIGIFAPDKITDSTEMRIAALGDIELTGTISGRMDDFTTQASILTSAGDATFNFTVSPATEGYTNFLGKLAVSEINTGALTGIDKLGNVSLLADLNGRFRGEELHASTKTTVRELNFNGYRYHDINMNGVVNNRNFLGFISSNDPNLRFTFNGMLDFNDSIPRYDFEMRLSNADLYRLNFNTRDSVSILRCDVTANGSGFDPDILNAEILFENLEYINHLDTLSTGQMRIVGKNSEHSKFLALYSDFTDAEFRSRTSYPVLYKYFTQTLYSYLPSLGADDTVTTGLAVRRSADPDNYSLLDINFKHVDNISKVFLPGLVIAEGSKLNFIFNPDIERFSLTLQSDYIEKDNFFISDLDLHSRNQADSISLYIRAKELYGGGLLIPNLSVIGGAKDNVIYTGAHFSDPRRKRSALIGFNAILGRDTVTGIPNVTIRSTPSSITNGDNSWGLFARAVADSSSINVSAFSIEGSGQSLRANGILSANKSDTLHIDLSNFDLAALTQFTDRLGYEIEGRTNGHADIISGKKNGIIYADILLDSLRVNDHEIPPGLFRSEWDFQNERARFALSARNTGDTVIRGYYRPTDGRYLGKATLNGIDLALLDPFFDGILRDTEGYANADIDITGQRRDLRINGTVKVPQLSTTVDYLNVPYTIKDAEIKFNDNVMLLEHATINDPEGNAADMNLMVDLRAIRNVNYDINIILSNLMVMNTDRYYSDIVYGKVYASGGASIKGDRRGVNMDIRAITDNNSAIYMPLRDKQDVSDMDFITFVQPSRFTGSDSTDIYNERRMRILERNRRVRAERSRGAMDIDLTVNVLPNTYFSLLIDPQSGHTITGRGNGNLNMKINPRNGEFSMYGDYEITEGTYNFTLENIIEKPFVIEQGSSIQWTGNPLTATLNISALYRLKTSLRPVLETDDITSDIYNIRIPIDCRIMLTDNLSQPTVTFSITAPSADPETQSILANLLNTQESMATQFFFLIATGSFYSDTGSTGNIGLTATSNTAIDFLTNQFSNWISSDKFNLGIRYKLGDELTSDEFGVDFSQELFNSRLLLEVEGNYAENRTTISENTKNLTGDFYLTWLIDRSGNLKAKIFSRTIDRFDENQGLQENGLGIYYTEYFNNAKDIRRNLRERFTRQRKRRQAAAQQEADRRELEMLLQEEQQNK